jgi:hypothetical protein
VGFELDPVDPCSRRWMVIEATEEGGNHPAFEELAD